MNEKMLELKNDILDYAKSENRKEVNKRMVEERNLANKLREEEIARKRKEEAEANGTALEEYEDTETSGWSRGGGKVER